MSAELLHLWSCAQLWAGKGMKDDDTARSELADCKPGTPSHFVERQACENIGAHQLQLVCRRMVHHQGQSVLMPMRWR